VYVSSQNATVKRQRRRRVYVSSQNATVKRQQRRRVYASSQNATVKRQRWRQSLHIVAECDCEASAVAAECAYRRRMRL
jgi:hypothetical protein